MNSEVIGNFFRLVTIITSFLSPGAVYCSRSVCYLPQGLSVECLNLQAPTFLGRIFKSPRPHFYTDPKFVVFPEGHLRSFKGAPKRLARIMHRFS